MVKKVLENPASTFLVEPGFGISFAKWYEYHLAVASADRADRAGFRGMVYFKGIRD